LTRIEIYGDPEVHPQDEEYWGHVNPVRITTIFSKKDDRLDLEHVMMKASE